MKILLKQFTNFVNTKPLLKERKAFKGCLTIVLIMFPDWELTNCNTTVQCLTGLKLFRLHLYYVHLPHKLHSFNFNIVATCISGFPC